MAGSLWKRPFIHRSVVEAVHKFFKANPRPVAPIRVMSRASTIIKQFVGLNFEVHNGKEFWPLNVTEEMVGHKFGEFAFTRKFPTFPKKKKKR